MVFECMSDNLYESSNSFDLSLTKIGAFYESAQREFKIMNMEASDAYDTETIGPMEYRAMCEEAKDKLSTRFIDAVKKIIDAVIKFFSDAREKVVTLYRDSKITNVISKAKEKVKMNPILRRKKTFSALPIYEPVMKCYEEQEKYLDRQAAACNTGNFDKDVFDEHETKFQINLNSLKAKAEVLTIDALINKIESATKEMDKATARAKEVTNSIQSKAKEVHDNSSELLTILKKKANIAKEKASYIMSVVIIYCNELKKSVMSTIEKVKDDMDSKATKARKVKPNKPVKESVYESTYDLDSYLDNLYNSL